MARPAVKDFVALGKIRQLDDVQYNIFDPKQRRNPGAPMTQDLEAQMGTQKFALYEPIKKNY